MTWNVIALILGTKSGNGERMEYRWAKIARKSTLPTHQYCRFGGPINDAFVRLCFSDSLVYSDLKSAEEAIAAEITAEPFLIKTELVTDKVYPP